MPPRLASLAVTLSGRVERMDGDPVALSGETHTIAVNGIDATSAIAKVAAADDLMMHVKAFDLPAQERKLVLDARGLVALGRLLAASHAGSR